MRIAIMESITSPGGHEVDFDRILIEELRALGHEVFLYVPEKFTFKLDYGAPIHYLKGEGVSYAGVTGIKKNILSLKREFNRQRWFYQMYKLACSDSFDAVIVPTSTYRYLRALTYNPLKKIPVPLIFIVHGINPGEAPKFINEADRLKPFNHVKSAVLTFGNTVFGQSLPNIFCVNPPAYIPRDIEINVSEEVPSNDRGTLKLGFFGQYRREKRLDAFLDAFLSNQYTYPVELLIQGATMRPEDADDFKRTIAKYDKYSNIKFIHRGLFGAEWQKAIASVDAILMPYSSERYRYHWAGMLFTAIGHKKPVILSDEINPEVLARYKIGCSFQKSDPNDLQRVLTYFINTFPEQKDLYYQELSRAYQDYSPLSFAGKLVEICRSVKSGE